MGRLDLVAMMMLAGCPGAPDDTGSRYADCALVSGECECAAFSSDATWPVSDDDPQWGTLGCPTYVQCPQTSAAAFAVEEDYSEYVNHQFFGRDGRALSYYATTDGVDSQDPADCLSAGVATWSGPVVRDCLPPSGGERFTWPGCLDEWPLAESSGAPGVGYLTQTASWDATQAARDARCLAQTACTDQAGDALVALIRFTLSSAGLDSGRVVEEGAVDVFNAASGELVGTAELGRTPATYGVVPLGCLTATPTPTAGCFVGAE